MQKEQIEKYLSDKYSKNITFTPIYQNKETLNFYINVLIDGVKSEDQEFLETVKKDIEYLNRQKTEFK